MLTEPEEHDWGRRGHFWSVNVETEEAWHRIAEWLDRTGNRAKVQERARIVNGGSSGRKLMIEDQHRSVLTNLMLKFSTA